MKNRFGAIAEEEETKIDITPMLDVVFIMLIFFIVTATFINEKGIDINPPPPDQKVETKPEKGNILIAIDENNYITVKGRDVDTRRITANVQRLMSEKPDAKVIIQASKRSKNNTLVQVIDSVLAAGVDEYSLAPSSE